MAKVDLPDINFGSYTWSIEQSEPDSLVTQVIPPEEQVRLKNIIEKGKLHTGLKLASISDIKLGQQSKLPSV